MLFNYKVLTETNQLNVMHIFQSCIDEMGQIFVIVLINWMCLIHDACILLQQSLCWIQCNQSLAINMFSRYWKHNKCQGMSNILQGLKTPTDPRGLNTKNSFICFYQWIQFVLIAYIYLIDYSLFHIYSHIWTMFIVLNLKNVNCFHNKQIYADLNNLYKCISKNVII